VSLGRNKVISEWDCYDYDKSSDDD